MLVYRESLYKLQALQCFTVNHNYGDALSNLTDFPRKFKGIFLQCR